MKLLTKFLPIALCTSLFISCSDDDNNDNADPGTTITNFVKTNENYSLLAAALKATGLDTVLNDTSTQYTVFAPNNGALSAFLTANGFPNGLADIDTDEEVDLVRNILLNHVISGSELKANAVTASAPGYVKNAAAGPTDFTGDATNLSTYYAVDGNDVVINGGVTVTTPDAFDANNGIIHAIEEVIALPTIVTFATADPNFSTLVKALTKLTPETDFAGILSRTIDTNSDGLNPSFTVFAPNDDAFAKLDAIPAEGPLTNVLLHHVIKEANVVSGDLSDDLTATTLNGDITINLPGNDNNPAKITSGNGTADIDILAVDIQASNGVIHVIESVLLP